MKTERKPHINGIKSDGKKAAAPHARPMGKGNYTEVLMLRDKRDSGREKGVVRSLASFNGV